MTFSNRVEKLLATVENGSLPTHMFSKTEPRVENPQGWAAGVQMDGNEGTITTRPMSGQVKSWATELAAWGFDPEVYEVVEPVRVSTWEVLTKTGDGDYETKQMWAYRANIKTRSGLTAVEIDELCKPVKSVKPSKTRFKGSYTLVVPVGDWQIGKADGDGLAGSVARIEASTDKVLQRVTDLRKRGYEVGRLLVASLGDLGEGCVGHYQQQTFSVELDRRDQNKVVRRLARNMLMKLAPHFENVTVAAVAGNHGENRQNGKSFTTTNDNDDIAIWESVAETLAVNPEAFGHIEWLLPRSELSVSLKVGEQIIGLAHGHQAKGSDIGKWWQGQVIAGRPTADAGLLLTGHFHHFRMAEVAKGRWWLQIPAQDGGSDWFEEMAGSGNSHGQVTFLLHDNGWSELSVL